MNLLIRKFYLLVAILFFAFSAVLAQNTKIRFEHFSVDDGLSQSSGTAILQDRQGFIWIGTQDGLNKFDGVSFKVYSHDPEDSTTISKNSIEMLFEDGEGYIWIASKDGTLDRFNPRDEISVSYTESLRQAIEHEYVIVSAIDASEDGATWFATYNGLVRFNSSDKTFSFFPVNKSENERGLIKNLKITKSGDFWITNYEGTLIHFEPNSGKMQRFNFPVAKVDQWRNENATTLYEDSAGFLWIGTFGVGLFRFDPFNYEFKQFKHDPENTQSLSSNIVTCIAEDAHKNLWIGHNHGLSYFLKAENRFVNYQADPYEPGSLTSNEVSTIMLDNSATLWIGTVGGGVSKYDPQKQKFAHLTSNLKHPEAMPGSFVWSVFEDSDGWLWVGTQKGGLTAYKQNSCGFETFRHDPDDPTSLGSDNVFSLCEDDRGNIWIATTGSGLNKFDKKTRQFTRYTCNRRNPEGGSGCLGNYLRALSYDENGFLWIATMDAGLAKFDLAIQEFTHFMHQADDACSISSNHLLCIYDDGEGSIWTGTSTNGLNRFDKKTEKVTRYMQDENDRTSLSNNYIMSICKDLSGNIWVGTYHGLNRMNSETGKFTRYTTHDGLPNNVIYGLQVDNRNNLWISTNKGLSRMDTENGQFTNFDVADGLQSNEFNAGALYKNKRGEMFFGGINGLNVFQPDSIWPNPSIPPVVITGVKKFDEYQQLPGNETPLQFSYKDNFLTFEFVALNYTNPLKNQYAYMLEGFNNDWIYCGNQRYATYTNLSPGDYTFRVKGSNNDGVWNEAGASIKISVSPPFWRTWWFIMFCILSFIAGFVIYVSHLKDKEKKKTELNKKFTELKLQALRAQMNPHFIFNTLNSIQYFISNKDQKSAFSYLSKFSKLMRMVLDNSDRSKVTISEELETLKLYLELEALRFEGKFDYHLDVDSSIDIHNREIPTLLIQPFVENAIQHGLKFKRTNGTLDIKLEAESGSVVCFIEDNGIGIEKSLEKNRQNGNGHHKSAGMKVSSERLETLNALKKNGRGIEVVDLSKSNGKQQGTRVKIIIPTEN